MLWVVALLMVPNIVKDLIGHKSVAAPPMDRVFNSHQSDDAPIKPNCMPVVMVSWRNVPLTATVQSIPWHARHVLSHRSPARETDRRKMH